MKLKTFLDTFDKASKKGRRKDKCQGPNNCMYQQTLYVYITL